MNITWWYKQKNYRGSALDKIQIFIVFQLIPFIICSIIASGIVLVLFLPLLLISLG